MATRASSGAHSSSSTSLSVLRRGLHVRLIDPASGGAYAFAKSESRERDGDGLVRGWLEVVPSSTRDAQNEDGETFDAKTMFRVLVRRDHGASGREGQGALYYGFEHIKSGLLLQRRQRGLQKLVFCSDKFGVNEQFDCHDVEDGVLRLVNRRCGGMWEVRVCVLKTESEIVEREVTMREKRSLAGDSVVHKGFGHMKNLISTFKRAQVGHVTEMNHMEDVIKSAIAQKNNQKLLFRIFVAWKKCTVKSKIHDALLRKAGIFHGERIIMSMKKVFSSWVEQCERTKRITQKADDRYHKIQIKCLRAHFHDWRNVTSRNKWCRLAVHRFSIKMERRTKSAVLIAWQGIINTLQVEREKRRRAERMMLEAVNNKLYSSFFAWQDAVARSRMNDAKARQSLARLTSRLMYRAFAEWHAVVKDKRSEALSGRKAITWFLCSTQRRYFTEWRSAARESARVRRVLARFVSRRRMSHLCHAFESWKEVLSDNATRKIAVAKALRRWQHRRVAQAFASWCEVVEHASLMRRRASQVAEKMRQNSSMAAMSMCFWGWAQVTETSRITRLNEKKENDLLEQRCEIFEKLQATRKLRKSFLSWYDYSTRKREQRSKLIWALNRMTGRILFTAFNAWMQVAADNKRRRDLARKVCMRASNRLVSTAFYTWREVVEDNIAARIHLSKVEKLVNLQLKNARRAQLRRLLCAWRERTVQKRQQRKLVAKAITSMRNRDLASAFNCWKAATQKYVHERRLMTRVAQRLRKSDLQRAFDTWSEFVEGEKSDRIIYQKAVKKMYFCKLYYAFTGWLTRTQEKKRQNALLLRAIHRFSGRRLQTAFYDWAHTVATLRHQRESVAKIVRRMKNRVIFEAFETWRVNAHNQRMQKAKIHKVIQHMMQRVLYASFDTWRIRVETKKFYRTVVGEFHERVRDRSLRASFTLWVSLTKENKERKLSILKEERLRSNKLAQILGSVTRRTLGYAFMQWRDHIRDVQRMKLNEIKARRVCIRMQTRTQSRAFARWLSYVDERRRIMKTAQTVILRMRQRQVSTAFQGWLSAVRTEKRQRIIIAHSIKRLKFRFLVKVFYTWIEFVHEARATRAYAQRIDNLVRVSLAKIRQRTKSRALNAWQFYTIDKKRQRTLVTKSLRRMGRHMLAKSFDGWISQITMMKRHRELVSTSIKRMQHRLLGKVFNSWSEYLKQIHSFRVVERRLQNIERAIAPLHVTHASVSDMVRVNVAMRWGLARNERIYRNPMFSAWLAYVRKISEHRTRTAQKMHEILATRACRKFLRVWRQYTEVMVYYRSTLKRSEKRVIRKVFSEWKMNVRPVVSSSQTQTLARYERASISTGWDFDKSYEENVRLLGVGSGRQTTTHVRYGHSSQHSTPKRSPITIQPIVVEPDSYEKQYRAVMSECESIEAEVDALSTVKESLQGQFDLLARDEALRASFARVSSTSSSLLQETRTYYSEIRFREPFSPVKPRRCP